MAESDFVESPKQGEKPRRVGYLNMRVMMFNILLQKRFYNLSDEQAEYQITDRISFRDFLGLSSGDRVPNARTIWLFQDTL